MRSDPAEGLEDVVVKSRSEREEVGVSWLDMHAWGVIMGLDQSDEIVSTLDPVGHVGGMYRAMMFHRELPM